MFVRLNNHKVPHLPAAITLTKLIPSPSLQNRSRVLSVMLPPTMKRMITCGYLPVFSQAFATLVPCLAITTRIPLRISSAESIIFTCVECRQSIALFKLTVHTYKLYDGVYRTGATRMTELISYHGKQSDGGAPWLGSDV